ncbi:MAG TPA: ABC transporter permease, partial [Spirochaetota bacterium]|nr:ABC transporter permease [Spirochaetota bacterium]
NIETWSAIAVSLQASLLSITAALIIGAPAGFVLGYYEFPGRRQIRAVFDTLLALPTVVVGLVVYGFVSSRGPLGHMELLFTVSGIVVAQTILILPIVISLTASAIESLDMRLGNTLITLGASRRQIVLTSLYEAKIAVLTAAVTAYGRAISEVGVSMMIGGNIKWHTRTITTAIALESGKGNFAMGIALGLVLLTIAFTVNASLIILKKMSK